MGSEDRKSGNGQTANGNGKRNSFLIAGIVILGIAGLIFGIKWFAFHLTYTKTDDAQIDADLLPVSSKVPGRIGNIYVSEGDKVRVGQIIAQIDPTDYKLALSQAEARLESARRDLEKAVASMSLTATRNRISVRQSATSLHQVNSGVAIAGTQQDVNSDKLKKDYERALINSRRAEEHYAEVAAAADQAQEDMKRAEKLFESGVISKEQWDRAQTNAAAAKARLAQVAQEKSDTEKQVETARSNLRGADIDSMRTIIAEQDRKKASLSLALSKQQQKEENEIAETSVRGLRAQVKALESAAEQARVALRETRILSPVDGIVSKKISMEAQIVPAGQPIFFIVNPAGTHAFANIEETKLHNIAVGAKVKITVDALPGKVFTGKVSSIGTAANSKFSLIPTSSASGQFIKTTQRIKVKIRMDGDLSELIPGMNAIVTIKNR